MDDHNCTQWATRDLPPHSYTNTSMVSSSVCTWNLILMKRQHDLWHFCMAIITSFDQHINPDPSPWSMCFTLPNFLVGLLSPSHSTCYFKPLGLQVLYDILVLSTLPCPPLYFITYISSCPSKVALERLWCRRKHPLCSCLKQKLK